MSEEWKKQDRQCPPCDDCGAALYEKFWGNGGWMRTEVEGDRSHDPSRCVTRLRARVRGLEEVAALLGRDVDEMMHGLRTIASSDTHIDIVREVAKRALARLTSVGVGDGAGESSGGT